MPKKKKSNEKTLRRSTQTDGTKWKSMSESKFSEVFRENQDCIPDWLPNFEYEYQKKGIDLIDSGFEYQIKFENLVKSTKNLENNCPKMNDGTIKKYLTDF